MQIYTEVQIAFNKAMSFKVFRVSSAVVLSCLILSPGYTLDISNAGLDSLPSFFGRLTRLLRLDLRNNLLSTLPTELECSRN